MNKNIEFIARNPYFETVAPRPYPAKEHLPEWYKKMPSYNLNIDGKRKLTVFPSGSSSVTPKMCTPMYDTFSTGYIIPLWADVEVLKVNGVSSLAWRTKIMQYEPHGGLGNGNDGNTGLTTPDGYSSVVYKWMNAWDIKTPPGYSCLITDPYANENSPFKAIGAIIDTDKSTLSILPPFWVRDDFEGIVEKGTPMIQVIPFKRDSWESSFSCYKDGEYDAIEDANFGGIIKNHYKRFVWSKKEFK